MTIIRLIALILVKKQNTKYIHFFNQNAFYSNDKTAPQVDLSIDGYETLENEIADISLLVFSKTLAYSRRMRQILLAIYLL